jgi:hypothetical protein
MSWAFKKAAKSFGRDTAINTAITGGMYGGLSMMTADEATNEPAHYAKWGIAAGVDVGWDIGVTAAATMMNPVASGLVMAGNIAAGLMGVDPASMALEAMDSMDASFDRMAGKEKGYHGTQASSQMIQRQVQNLHGAGSNVAEMMHN